LNLELNKEKEIKISNTEKKPNFYEISKSQITKQKGIRNFQKKNTTNNITSIDKSQFKTKSVAIIKKKSINQNNSNKEKGKRAKGSNKSIKTSTSKDLLSRNQGDKNRRFGNNDNNNYIRNCGNESISREKLNYQNKSNKNLEVRTLNRTPNFKNERRNAYNSNRNLTKITINPTKVENKDIHLVFEGKEETIKNYTNQEMIDDENEYMVECLKILLKLKIEDQPRVKQKVNFNFPEEDKNKKIALFDLDETLVHCTKEKKGINGDTVNVKLPTNKTVPVGLNIRSNWKEALDLIKSHYNIVVYTASHQSYADAVLNYIDKENKYFQYRLYRNHCIQCDVDGFKFYVKDLDTLNKHYNLKDVVLIDNSVLSFAYHLNNGIPIVPFIEQKDDTQLLMLAYYLVSIAGFDDLTEENKKHINIEYYLMKTKKLAEEEEEDEDEEEEKNDENDINKQNNKEKEKQNENNNNDSNKETVDNNINKTVEINNNESTDNKSEGKMKKGGKNMEYRQSKTLPIKNSKKALKIAEDMKNNIADIYKKNSD
jgi:CTD small phosphatase-like protein 2